MKRKSIEEQIIMQLELYTPKTIQELNAFDYKGRKCSERRIRSILNQLEAYDIVFKTYLLSDVRRSVYYLKKH